MNTKGWNLLWLPILQKRITKLEARVTNLQAKNPKTFQDHRDSIFLAKLYHILTDLVPTNPDNPGFKIGNMLGNKYSIFRRVKKPLPSRDRMFFVFSSQLKQIIYVWLNDKKSIRKAGDFNDVYKVFVRKLESGTIPHTFEKLASDSTDLNIAVEEVCSEQSNSIDTQ